MQTSLVAKNEHLGIPALVAGALGIAFAPILAKLAVNADSGTLLSPAAVAFWRMALAAPFFLLPLLKRPNPGTPYLIRIK